MAATFLAHIDQQPRYAHDQTIETDSPPISAHTGMLADLNIPKALMSALGHSDCGIYAEVTAAGEIAAGNEIEIV